MVTRWGCRRTVVAFLGPSHSTFCVVAVGHHSAGKTTHKLLATHTSIPCRAAAEGGCMKETRTRVQRVQGPIGYEQRKKEKCSKETEGEPEEITSSCLSSPSSPSCPSWPPWRPSWLPFRRPSSCPCRTTWTWTSCPSLRPCPCSSLHRQDL